MRKLLALVLMFTLLSVSVACAQSAGEFSSISDDELLALLEMVQSEIVARKLEKTACLNAGTYIGGRDFPAGHYVLSLAGTEDDSGILSLRSVLDPEDSSPSKIYDFVIGDEVFSYYITMEDGDTLILPFSCTLTISPGVVFR